MDVEKPQLFIDEEKIKNFILALTPEEARKIGIESKNGLNYLKKKAREGKLNFNTPVIKKIIKYYYST